MMKYCEEEGIPLLRSSLPTTQFIELVDLYLAKSMAEEIAVHGVCVNVAGIGILLRGKSGVGKSETAHTLIRRGHCLVADDIVVLKKISQVHGIYGHSDSSYRNPASTGSGCGRTCGSSGK